MQDWGTTPSTDSHLLKGTKEIAKPRPLGWFVFPALVHHGVPLLRALGRLREALEIGVIDRLHDLVERKMGC